MKPRNRRKANTGCDEGILKMRRKSLGKVVSCPHIALLDWFPGAVRRLTPFDLPRWLLYTRNIFKLLLNLVCLTDQTSRESPKIESSNGTKLVLMRFAQLRASAIK
jgi:hypothetical protein